MELELPFAEGPNGDLWFIGYRESCGREPVAAPVEPTLPPPRIAMARVSSPVDANGSPVREEASWA
jgi:hypothetical protein